MTKLAIVGSRQGANLEHLECFLQELWLTHPDTILVSGGAAGVDVTAEQGWLALGGQVVSYRVRELSEEEFCAEKWELGGPQPRIWTLDDVTFADWSSALIYRDMLIAQECNKLVAFMRKGGSRGSKWTCLFAGNEQHPVWEFEA